MSTPIRIKRLRPGDDTDTYCGRCKAERAHLVAAMKSDTVPAQVICRTCQTRHNFRAPAAADGPKRAKTTTRVARTQPSLERGPNDPPPRSYSARESYAAGDFVEHPVYGLGRVEGARGAKIDVRFRDAVRTLVHAG